MYSPFSRIYANSVTSSYEAISAILKHSSTLSLSSGASRPVFAKDCSDEKEHIRAFYQEEAKNPLVLTDYEGYQAAQLMKMTHMEPFLYPVWSELAQECAKKLLIKKYVLFDYRKRNPLTNDARTVVLEEKEKDSNYDKENASNS